MTVHEIHLNAVRESPTTQTETLKCFLTTQQEHSSHGNMKLSPGYETCPRPRVNARVVFNPHLILSHRFQILNQVTPALALHRFLTAMHIDFFSCMASSQRAKKDVQLLRCSLQRHREFLHHRMLKRISSVRGTLSSSQIPHTKARLLHASVGDRRVYACRHFVGASDCLSLEARSCKAADLPATFAPHPQRPSPSATAAAW